MNENYYTEKLLEKAFAVVKKNIDNEDVKTEVFSLNLSEKNARPNYTRVSINRKKYDTILDDIMNYFIENEWYEDCVEVKEYQTKLKKLQNNEQQEVTRTETESVEA